jgi:hypothetical protein
MVWPMMNSVPGLCLRVRNNFVIEITRDLTSPSPIKENERGWQLNHHIR